MAQCAPAGATWQQVMLDQLRGALAGGVDVVQIRERGLETRPYAAFLRACGAVVDSAGGRLVVNDRLDLALVTGCGGIHLREDSVPIEAARRLAPVKFLVGRSVHAPGPAAAARNADYMIAGSVFETLSKPGVPAALGLAGLQAVVSAARGCPVWAVGGVTPERLREVRACGAQGIAAIGAFIPAAPTADVAGAVHERAAAFRLALDRSR